MKGNIKSLVGIWILIMTLGLLFNLFFLRFWGDFQLANGWQLLPLHVAVFSCVFFFFIVCMVKHPSAKEFVMAIILLFVLFIPALKKYDQRFIYVNVTDSNLYLQTAQYMLEHKTFNSNDNYFIDKNAGIETTLGKQYLFQPGYKYYVAMLLWFTHQKQVRLIQFLALALYSISSLFLFLGLSKAGYGGNIIKYTYLYFLLLIPSAVTNINEGLTEGFFLSLFFIFFYFFATKKYFPAIVVLALCVFVRQFFLIMALPLFGIILFQTSGKKFYYLFIFVVLLLLPVYHNFYYAGIFRFTADYSWLRTRFSEVTDNWFYFSVVKPYRNTWQFYLGIGPAKDLHWLQAMLFIPAGLALSVYLFACMYKRNVMMAIFWVLLMALLVLPTISFSGIGSFPRFQLLTYSTIIIFAIVLMQSKAVETFLKSIGKYWARVLS